MKAWFELWRGMSALPPEADIRQRLEHVCFVPKADIGIFGSNDARFCHAKA